MHSTQQLSAMPYAARRSLANLHCGTVTTGHAAFDRAANHPVHGYIGTGNVESNVQASSYVRAGTETECNGYTFPADHLRAHDLQRFRRLISSPDLAFIRDNTEDRGGILYVFLHRDRGRRVIHGWVLTDVFERLIYSRTTGPTWKSEAIMDDMRRRVSWRDRGPRLLN